MTLPFFGTGEAARRRGLPFDPSCSGDLLRGLYVETSVAIQFFWGVSEPTVPRWRQALGIESRATESFLRSSSSVGSIYGNAPGNTDRLRSFNEQPWTAEEISMLSRFSRAEIMARTGRTGPAIEQMRTRHKLKQQRINLTCALCSYTWLPDTDRIPKRCARQPCLQPLNTRR